jgi:hypothetical protein
MLVLYMTLHIPPNAINPALHGTHQKMVSQ